MSSPTLETTQPHLMTSYRITEEIKTPSESVQPRRDDLKSWLEEARREITIPGCYLAYSVDNERKVVPIDKEAFHIGRSLNADVRLEDINISRRHALIVSKEDKVEILEDRTLNPFFVNKKQVKERQELHDEDEIIVGRYRLYFLAA